MKKVLLLPMMLMGVALNETGLAANLINSIPFNSWSVLAVLIGSGVICYTLSNFIPKEMKILP